MPYLGSKVEHNQIRDKDGDKRMGGRKRQDGGDAVSNYFQDGIQLKRKKNTKVTY